MRIRYIRRQFNSELARCSTLCGTQRRSRYTISLYVACNKWHIAAHTYTTRTAHACTNRRTRHSFTLRDVMQGRFRPVTVTSAFRRAARPFLTFFPIIIARAHVLRKLRCQGTGQLMAGRQGGEKGSSNTWSSNVIAGQDLCSVNI